MKNIRFIVLSFLVSVVTCVQAATITDYFIALADYTVTSKTYETAFTSLSNQELKCKNYIVYAEVPSAQAAGTFAWRCGSSNTGRFLYLQVNGVEDTSRMIPMLNGYSSDFTFTSNDLTQKNGKYYLVFSTTDDYKAKSMKYTLTAGDTGGGSTGGDSGNTGGETPATSGDLHFWFFNASDAATNNVTNDATVFSGMVSSGSNLTGTITIDGTNYSVTRRTGDIATFGSFTIPANYTANFYALAVSSGNGARQINLVCGGNKYEMPVPGGSSAYQQIEYQNLPAGTYSIEREGSDNVRLGVVVLKFISSGGGETTTAVTGVSLNKPSTSLEAGQTETLTATVTPSDATNQNVTWSTSNSAVATVANGVVSAVGQGTATITVTTEDGGKTSTCTVTVTAPAAPVPVTAIALNKTTTTIYVGSTETLTVSYTPTDANTGKGITWTSSDNNVATVSDGIVTAVAFGTATITATSEGNFTATCTVTVDIAHPTSVTLNKTSIDLQIGGNETLTATVEPSNATNKNVTWESSNTAVATVDANGNVVGVSAGTATITVTTVDGGKTHTCTVTVTAGPPVPSTTLSLHEPEVYETNELGGGYNTPLVIFNQHEYEVYYFGKYKPASSDIAVAFTKNHKEGTLVSSSSGSTTAITAKDGWFTGSITDLEGSFKAESEISPKASARDEFAALPGDIQLKNKQTFELHISGYDQFSIVAQDKKRDTKGTNPDDNQYWEVYIDDVLQEQYYDKDNATTRRYGITTGRHVIKLRVIGSEKCKLYGFSLRLAQVPRTKWIKGNDSTQNVLQTTSPKPVYYFTKYNSKGETRLEWDGATATGITLTKQGTGAIGDTLVLGGAANCPVGTYAYKVVSYYNGVESNSVPGKIHVTSDLKALNDTVIEAFAGEEMDEITFRYYALNASDVNLQWTNGTPAGIAGNGVNGKYTIGGTPTENVTSPVTYPYVISVAGSKPITGKITIKPLDLGNNPVLYLYKNNRSYLEDGVYKYLKGKGVNLIERKAKEDGRRPAEQYSNYKWMLISEDVDADNKEVLDVIGLLPAELPVLNLKGFTYAAGRLNWGQPNNGSVDTTSYEGSKIYIHRDDHPIFAAFTGKKKGDPIQILKPSETQGIMPIDVTLENTLCLATGYTRDIEDYMAYGELKTTIHEIPAASRGGQKYICLPLARKAELTTDGEKLIDAIINYLTKDNSAVINPSFLQINKFSLLGVDGNIDQEKNTIEMQFNILEYPELDLKNMVPAIQLEDTKYTFVTPASGDTVNFQYSTFMPVEFVVSDYISRRVYEVTVRMYNPMGVDEVYTAGEWVNIYDIYGRKITTTNEDIYSMELPHGMYIVVTESGETIKMMR